MESLPKDLHRDVRPCVALKGEQELHATVAELLKKHGHSYRVLSMSPNSPLVSRKQSGARYWEKVHAIFKTPAVVVLFLTPKALLRISKEFEFLRDRRDGSPKPVLVFVGGAAAATTPSSSSGSKENVNPSSEALQSFVSQLRKTYRIDLKDSVLVWDQSQPEASASSLGSVVEAQSAAFYADLVAKKRKSLKQSKKANSKVSDVFRAVRKLFLVGMYLEFQRQPVEALAAYHEAFDFVRNHVTPARDELEQVMFSALCVSFKIFVLSLRHGRLEDLKVQFLAMRRVLRDWVKALLPLPSACEVWSHEFSSALSIAVAELLRATSASTRAGGEDGDGGGSGDVLLQAFHHFREAASSFQLARAASERVNSATTVSLAQYDEKILNCLKTAYAEVRRVRFPLKREKMRIAVMIASEYARCGSHKEALEMCQRISRSVEGSVCRYKSESWWPLLGVVDAVAARSAVKLDEPVVAMNHALRCLGLAAQSPTAVRDEMTHLLIELRRLNLGGDDEAVEWMLDDESVIVMQLKRSTPSRAAGLRSGGAGGASGAILGLSAAGTGLSLCITSHFPMVLQFDSLVCRSSSDSVVSLAGVPSPLTLKPREALVLGVPRLQDGAVLSFACLSFGCIRFVCEFDASQASYPVVRALSGGGSNASELVLPAFYCSRNSSNSNRGALPVAKVRERMSAGALVENDVKALLQRVKIDAATGCVDCFGVRLPFAIIRDRVLNTLVDLRSLDLSKSALGNDGCAVLAAWLAGGCAPRLSTLVLWDCQLTAQSGTHISSILRSCPALRVLNLGLNVLGDGGVASFARSLQIASALEELVLWRICLSKTGLIVLTDNLLPPSRLRTLDIRSNEFGEGCDAVLASFLSKNTALLGLYIADCPGLLVKDFAAAVAQSNFSLQTFGEDVDASVRSLGELAKRNQGVSTMVRDGSLALPFKELRCVPSILLQPLGFGRRVTHIDLSHNQIAVLPPEMAQLENVSQFVASHNKLSMLTVEVARWKNLTFLDASHNLISVIPSEIGQLRLRHLLLGNNEICSIAPEMFVAAAPICQSLQELDLSYNRLSSVPSTVSNLQALQHLHLNNNVIAEVFSDVCKMMAASRALKTLNLNHNLLQTLPPPLCEFKDRVSVSGNPFVLIPPEVVSRGPDSVWDYLADMLNGQQICSRLKLMFVGQGNVGKTTLLKALTRGKVDAKNTVMGLVTGKGVRKQTDGIMVEDWMPEEGLTFSTWDFAGQEVYYSTHQFFLSQRSLYLVVFSLAEPLQEGNIISWLNSLQVRAPGVSFLLVATHADRKATSSYADLSEKLQSAISRWSRLYRKEGRVSLVKPASGGLCFFPVSSLRKTGNGLAELREALVRIAKAQPCMQEQVPKIYLSLLETIRRKRAEIGEPFVDWATVRSWGVVSDDRVLRRACRLLHDWGDIVSFQDAGALSDLVILDPNWLTQFMTTIVGVNSPLALANKSTVSPAMLPQLWRMYPQNLHQPLCRLLEKFEVWIKLSSGDYLVPCLLQSQPTRNLFFPGGDSVDGSGNGIIDAGASSWGSSLSSGVGSGAVSATTSSNSSSSGSGSRGSASSAQALAASSSNVIRPLAPTVGTTLRTVGRFYIIPFCPHGFFGHLLLRLWSFCEVLEYWSTGAVVRSEPSSSAGDAVVAHLQSQDQLALVEVKPHPTENNPFQASVQILARGTVAPSALMTKLVFTLHAYIRDWYGGLADHVTTMLPCVECLSRRKPGGSFHLFAANEFIRDYVGGQQQQVSSSSSGGVAPSRISDQAPASAPLQCPMCQSIVSPSDLVPEIVGLAEAQGYAEQVVEEKSLGSGGFAEVFLGKWKGMQVAIKKLFLRDDQAESFTLETFEDFAMEVHMMSRLKHPNVVQLYAAYSRPPAIILEYVQNGSLDGVLKGMVGPIDWLLVLRMATDIGRGMEYLHGHTPKIVHRDLKSPNILVQSLNLADTVLLKVADLGLSCFYTGNVSGKMIENPRWVSPETLEHGVYTDKSDVFSFGIIMNELVTRQIPFTEVSFNAEVEKLILAGQRPTVLSASSDAVGGDRFVGVFEKYVKLMSECWSQNAPARPTFGAIVTRLLMMQEVLKQSSFL